MRGGFPPLILEVAISLDTKYRPEKFEGVLGQGSTIDILKNLLQNGRIFQKSYVFSGPSGIGKTTIARILARAMLCDNLKESGEPCNQCDSCREILEQGNTHSFKEMDAANHSGKEHIQKILENMKYYTLDGNERRIYLIDECHRLSKAAMDALLKPMEDNIPGTEDKRLVCLFCTTEPEKLRTTIKTRCMVFSVTEPDKNEVMGRLKHICEEEGFDYTEEGLELAYQEGNGHIRDMINLLEKVGRISSIDEESVREQLGLSARSNYYEILLNLGNNVGEAVSISDDTLDLTDADSVYKGLGEAAMTAYRLSKGIEKGVTGADRELALKVGNHYGERLLRVVDRVLESKKRITPDVLNCEIFYLHRLVNDDPLPQSSPPLAPPANSDGLNESEEEKEESESEDEDEEVYDEESRENAEFISSFGEGFLNEDANNGGSDDEDDDSSDLEPENDRDSESLEPANEEHLRNLF